jgi:prepilin-type processing-associated H-X9-DG protein
MKYLAYMNILFGDNHVQSSWTWKKWGIPWDTILVLKIWLKKILSINFHQKMSLKNIHVDIIAPNFTNYYRRIFKILKIMFFMDGTKKKWNRWGKLLHTHPLMFLYLWDKKKTITKIFWILIFDIVDVQIAAFGWF